MAKSRNRYISAQDYAGRLREKAKNKRLKAKKKGKQSKQFQGNATASKAKNGGKK